MGKIVYVYTKANNMFYLTIYWELTTYSWALILKTLCITKQKLRLKCG